MYTATPERVSTIQVKESTVLNPNLDPGIIERSAILDVHVKDEPNRHFNIEVDDLQGISRNDAL